MSQVNAKHIPIARVYSRAMLDLAESQGLAEQLLNELRELVDLCRRDAGFAAFMASPLIDSGDRSKSLEKLFRKRASDLLVDSLQVLNRKGRMEILPTLYATYRREYQERIGKIDVLVTTAVPLTKVLRRKLVDRVAEDLGKEVNLVETVEPSILGGMVMRVGDRKVDASVRREIQGLYEVVHWRATHVIHAERLVAAG